MNLDPVLTPTASKIQDKSAKQLALQVFFINKIKHDFQNHIRWSLSNEGQKIKIQRSSQKNPESDKTFDHSVDGQQPCKNNTYAISDLKCNWRSL